MAQPFDAVGGQIVGEVFPVAEGVFRTTYINYAPITATETGVLVYESGGTTRSGDTGARQMAWYDRGGKLLEAVGLPGPVEDPAISPDETWVAFRRLPGSRSDLWLRDLARGVEQRLTTDASFNSSPFWSPRGDRIVFESNRGSGIMDLYQKATSGTGPDELLLANAHNKFTSQWSRDGRFIVYSELDPKTKLDIWVLPMEGTVAERKPVSFLRWEFNEHSGQLSPDDHWMAYTSDKSGRREVYVRPFPSGEGEWRISIAGGELPRWRGDGRELFFAGADEKVMAAGVAPSAFGTRTTFSAGVPQPLFEAHMARTPLTNLFEYDVTRDGKRFLLNTKTSGPASRRS